MSHIKNRAPRLLRFAGSPGALVVGCMASAGVAASQLAIPLALGGIVDQALLREDLEALRFWVLLLGTLAMATFVCNLIHELIFGRARECALSHLQTRFLSEFLTCEIKRSEVQRLGTIQSILSSALPQIASFNYRVLGQGSLLTFQLLGLLGILIIKYGTLGLWVLTAVPVYILVPSFLAARIRQAQKDLLDATHRAQAHFQEAVLGHRELRIFNQEGWALSRLEEPLEKRMSKQTKMLALSSLQGITFTLSFVVGALVYWFGGKLVLAGELSVGDLVALVTIVGFLDGPLTGLSGLFGFFQTIRATSETVSEWFQEREPASEAPSHFSALGEDVLPVEVRNLVFRYRASDKPILDRISFRARPGEIIALIGPSGSGKSTLLDVLSGLYPPDSGEILFGGVELRSVAPGKIRRSIGRVSQDPCFFPVSIRENIRLGRIELSDSEVEEAAKLANIHAFIRSLPQGYQTIIGDQGVDLSGGQRQRIAIARAILGNPRILIFDEATSNLDEESGREVFRALTSVKQGRTIFVVTHQIDRAQDVDQVLTLIDGKLVSSNPSENRTAGDPIAGPNCTNS